MRSLFFHPTTKNLIRLFLLQDRLKAFGKAETLSPVLPQGGGRLRA
jgi:hypothetical protein